MRIQFNDLYKNLHISSTLVTPPHFSAYSSLPFPFSEDIYNYLKNVIVQKMGDDYDEYMIERLSSSYFKMYSAISEDSEVKYPFPSVITSNIKDSEHTLDLIRRSFPMDNINLDQTYPISVRYTDGQNIFLVERPPFIANVQYNTTRAYNVKQKNDRTVQMWMPWTLMLIYMDPSSSNYTARLYFNDSPLTSLDDLALPCFHMNMYDDASMCLNQTAIMLQQYLSENNTFDIHSVYNFLINDYMSGGWNTDLSLNSFDRIKRYSKSLYNIDDICLHKGDAERNITPSYSSKTGRNSLKKYYNNYINYFASLSLDEILSLISSVKSQLSNHPHNPLKTYQDSINSFISRNENDFLSKIFHDTYYNNYFNISDSFLLIIDPYHITDDNTIKEESYSKIYYSVSEYIIQLHQSKIDKYFDYSASVSVYNQVSDNISLYIKDDLTVVPIDQNFDYNIIPIFSNIKEAV